MAFVGANGLARFGGLLHLGAPIRWDRPLSSRHRHRRPPPSPALAPRQRSRSLSGRTGQIGFTAAGARISDPLWPLIASGGSSTHLDYVRNSYRERASRSAHAVATAELGVSVPGIVAQPPFSMIDRRSQDDALLNSVIFAGASACCRNLSTQIGASASTTAVCARSFAICSAVSPSVHPNIEKPSTVMTTAPISAPQSPGFKLGGNLTELISALPSPPPSPPPVLRLRYVGTNGAPSNTCDHVYEGPMNARSLRR